MDRNIAPEFHPLTGVEFLRPDTKLAENATPFHLFLQEGCGVLRLEIIARAGDKYQHHLLVNRMLSHLLTEGAGSWNAKEMSEYLDERGASLQVNFDKDFFTLTVFCLMENHKEIIPVVKAVLTEAHLGEKEFSLQVNRSIQRLKVSRQKVDFLAREKFQELVYGEKSVHGHKVEESDWKALTLDQVREQYEKCIRDVPFEVVMSGECTDGVVQAWMKELGGLNRSEEPSEKGISPLYQAGNFWVNKPDAVQNAILMACPVVNRDHVDFPGLQMVNLLLGGYFGSRLMSNIREDKGYTYGIGSGVHVSRDVSYLLISTEVGKDVCVDALNEIRKEIDALGNNEVDEAELALARQYMLGSFVRNSDGAFAMADRFKVIHFAGLDYAYYDRYLQVVNQITTAELKELANRYLLNENWIQVVAGNTEQLKTK